MNSRQLAERESYLVADSYQDRTSYLLYASSTVSNQYLMKFVILVLVSPLDEGF